LLGPAEIIAGIGSGATDIPHGFIKSWRNPHFGEVTIAEKFGNIDRELTPENTATFCARFLGQNQGTKEERKETQDRGNYPYTADG
jgi:hypothetical protein